MKKHSRIKKYIIFTILAVLALCIGFGVYWVNDTYSPNASAIQALVTDEKVTVTQKEWITFEPAQQTQTGFIFYPGGLVEPEAYAPLCRKIAEAGYLAVIVPMKLNLAVLSPDRADDVIQAYPTITNWAIGGHSLGGVMAASYAAKQDLIKGIVFYASYPGDETLLHSDIKALSIYGSLDGVANLDKVKQASLPEGSEMIEIEGGNHCYFGSYGMQKGDHTATIGNEEQITKATQETIQLLDEITE